MIHWLGAGLSSVPGIRRLAKNNHPLTLWNRTLSKAIAALNGLDAEAQARELEWGELASQVNKGDVVVSMLPASMHLKVADLCLQNEAHFVSSSYVSKGMQSLNDQAKNAGLCFVNEVGLDPGIDHLMAHVLVTDYKNSDSFAPDNEHYFRSHCGGFPKHPNEFKYKFSWSPLGVLTALKSPAQWMSGGKPATTNQPWKSVVEQLTRLPFGEETFQAYPNRDSLPFIKQYNFGDDWNVREFVRGTLRLNGWTDAWKDIFELIENSDGDKAQETLVAKSDQLWNDYRYDEGEPDRVVLAVELQVQKDGRTLWHEAYCLDEAGNEYGSAMARLVSLTTSIAVEAVIKGEFEAGVSAAPDDAATATKWLQALNDLGESVHRINVLSQDA